MSIAKTRRGPTNFFQALMIFQKSNPMLHSESPAVINCRQSPALFVKLLASIAVMGHIGSEHLKKHITTYSFCILIWSSHWGRHMCRVKAIGFDLFNTLITTDRNALVKGLERIVLSLLKNKINVEAEAFRAAHRESAFRYIEKARKDGRETHNSLWISSALKSFDYDIPPDDPIVSEAVEAYFSGLLDHCQPIPGTIRMLEKLKTGYSLGLLSNFTHPPAAHGLLDRLGFSAHFNFILISGELGYRKPHPKTFGHLIERFGVEKEEIIYVGDDPEPDIIGARNAGLSPVWFTYVRDNKIPSSAGILKGQIEQPEFEVPRISSWEELFLLLSG